MARLNCAALRVSGLACAVGLVVIGCAPTEPSGGKAPGAESDGTGATGTAASSGMAAASTTDKAAASPASTAAESESTSAEMSSAAVASGVALPSPGVTATVGTSGATAMPQPGGASATGASAASAIAPSAATDPGTYLAAQPSDTGLHLAGQAVIDSVAGRIYAPAFDRDGKLVTAVFSSANGRVVDVFATAGALALDADRGRLFVERAPGGGVSDYGAPDDPRPVVEPGERELVTLELPNGDLLHAVSLPPAATPQLLDGDSLAPLFDGTTGELLVFREHRVVRVDPESGDESQTFETGVVYADKDARAGQGPVPIHRAFIDPPSRLVYLSFVTLESAPWSGHTIVSYHLDSFAARGRGDYSTATYPMAAHGRLFGQLWNRTGFTSAWQWRDGAPFSTRMGPPDPPIGVAVDLETDRMFAANTTHLRVLDIDTMLPQRSLPHGLQDAGEVSLAGFDSASGNLVFVADGGLHLLRWPD